MEIQVPAVCHVSLNKRLQVELPQADKDHTSFENFPALPLSAAQHFILFFSALNTRWIFSPA